MSRITSDVGLASGINIADTVKKLMELASTSRNLLSVQIDTLRTQQTAITDPSATILLGARVAQGVVHMISTSLAAVMVRFVLFLVQVLTAVCWVYQFLNA